MANEWETFVKKFADMKEGEQEIFIKSITAGQSKYDTKHVRAKVAKSKKTLPKGDVLWLRSESGARHAEPWCVEILEELPEWVPGKPWENVLDALDRINKGASGNPKKSAAPDFRM